MILKHNHRQGKSREWTDSLNRFRQGIVTDEDFKKLEERVTNDTIQELNALHLSYANDVAQSHNDQMLNVLPTELHLIEANKKYPKGRKPTICKKSGFIEKRKILNVFKFKIGARCILTVNINTFDELVNGATGTIIDLEYKNNTIDCIIVKFDRPTCGRQHRNEKYPRLAEKYRANNGTPIFREEIEIQLKSRKGKNLGVGSIAKVYQFPLLLNYGSTAHSIQVRKFL